MKYLIASILIIICLVSWNCANTEIQNQTMVTEPQLVWADEFDEAGLPDDTKWSYDVGTSCDKPAGCGWGNNELQYYTDSRKENARVENGHLIIEAIREPYLEDTQYTSARLVTKGKGDWKYGRIEVRAKLPTGLGTWPAIWMLPSDVTYGGWPKSGEIDIMEHVGYEQDTVYGTVHTEAFNGMIGTQLSGATFQPTAEQQFHNYVLEWTDEKIDWYIDTTHYFTFDKQEETYATWPFDKPFHLILNIAVGGNWGGKMGVAEDIWPQRMEIDYVRIYQ